MDVVFIESITKRTDLKMPQKVQVHKKQLSYNEQYKYNFTSTPVSDCNWTATLNVYCCHMLELVPNNPVNSPYCINIIYIYIYHCHFAIREQKSYIPQLYINTMGLSHWWMSTVFHWLLWKSSNSILWLLKPFQFVVDTVCWVDLETLHYTKSCALFQAPNVE